MTHALALLAMRNPGAILLSLNGNNATISKVECHKIRTNINSIWRIDPNEHGDHLNFHVFFI